MVGGKGGGKEAGRVNDCMVVRTDGGWPRWFMQVETIVAESNSAASSGEPLDEVALMFQSNVAL